jgi:hypothetical protein
MKYRGKLISAYQLTRNIIISKGIIYSFRLGVDTISTLLWVKFFKPSTFLLQGKRYRYFYHPYNRTWINERIVEIPIGLDFYREFSPTSILEIGNVISHYVPAHHDVVDKYEKATGIINEDIITYKPEKKYDLILSISTLEHVGFDESEKDSRKFMYAIENMVSMVNSGGKIVITVPLGYNVDMEQLIFDKKVKFTHLFGLKRVTKDNRWKEFDVNTYDGSFSYDYPYPKGNAILVGIIQK